MEANPASPKLKGGEAALQLIERCIISSLLSASGQHIPEKISRLLDFAPDSFTMPWGGQIALAIRSARDNGTAPNLIKVVGLLEGESVAEAMRLSSDNSSLPLGLAELEAEPLLLRFQSQLLVATLGEAWQEARENPEKSVAVGRAAIKVIERAVSDAPGQHLPPIERASAFIKREIKSPPQLIKGVLHKATKMVIGGGSKSFKTWVQMDCAISVAFGIPWLGHETTPGRVLFVNFEIQEKFFQERLEVMAEARGVNLDDGLLDVWNLRGKAASYQIIVPMLEERVKSEGYHLIFLDPVYKLYGNTDENSAGEVAQLLNSFERLCVETDAAVAFGAHYSKGNQSQKEAIDRISGSGVFARDPDSIINFTKHEEENAFVVEPILRNLAPVEPFVVRWKYPLMERDDEADPTNLKQQAGGRRKEYDPLVLLRAIQDRTANNPISITDWAGASGVKRMTLSGYLDDMRVKGWIITIGEGTSSRKAITQEGLKAIGIST